MISRDCVGSLRSLIHRFVCARLRTSSRSYLEEVEIDEDPGEDIAFVEVEMVL